VPVREGRSVAGQGSAGHGLGRRPGYPTKPRESSNSHAPHIRASEHIRARSSTVAPSRTPVAETVRRPMIIRRGRGAGLWGWCLDGAPNVLHGGGNGLNHALTWVSAPCWTTIRRPTSRRRPPRLPIWELSATCRCAAVVHPATLLGKGAHGSCGFELGANRRVVQQIA
jgi:hypothetical protein